MDGVRQPPSAEEPGFAGHHRDRRDANRDDTESSIERKPEKPVVHNPLQKDVKVQNT